MRNILFSLFIVCGCDEIQPPPQDKSNEYETATNELAQFNYKGRICSVVAVNIRCKNFRGEPCPYWEQVVRFVDCGDEIINGQYINGKHGLK